jgi:hypothetical protein
MLTVKFEGVGEIKRTLGDMAAKQVPFAIAQALTKTAREIATQKQNAIRSTFDRPREQTVKAIQTKGATKQNLTAIVSIRDDKALPASEYLAANIKGGGRSLKRSEIMLRAAGILPSGMFTVPGAGAKLDAYGNMSRGQINQILSYFRTFGKTTLNTTRMNMSDAKRNKMAARRAYFIVPIKDRKIKLYPGIWQQIGKEIKPILMFVNAPKYNSIFEFEDIDFNGVSEIFHHHFNTEFENAMRTAK